MTYKTRLFRASVFASTASALAFGCFDFGDLSGTQQSCGADCDGSIEGSGGDASGPGFQITADASLTLQQGASAPVNVTVTRSGGFSGAINVTVSGLPAGATASPLTLTGGATTGTVTIAAAQTTPQSLSHLTIDGVSSDGALSSNTKMDLIVRGPPGSLDELFGDHGIVTTFSSGLVLGAFGVALDDSGNILVTGQNGNAQFSNFAMGRITASGAVDTSFGTKGVLQTTFTPKGNFLDTVFPLSAGFSLVAGGIGLNNGDVFARITSSGSFDPAFSPDGGQSYLVSVPSGSGMGRFAMDATGRIVGVGQTSGTQFSTYIARYLANGNPDTDFPNGSYVYGTGDSTGEGVAIQSDGKIVVLLSSTSGGYTGLSLVRMAASGASDNTFQPGGYVPPNILTQTQTSDAIAIQPDQKILALGSVSNGSSLVRYTTDGQLDTGFGSDGVVGIQTMRTLAVQSDGKILVVGSTDVPVEGGTVSEFLVGRLTSGGLPDSSFGTNGYAQTVMGAFALGGDAFANCVVVQPDGKIVVAGSVATSQNTRDFAIARYWP